MKNKLRAIANCILFLTIPIWIYPVLTYLLINDLFFDTNEEFKKRNRRIFTEVFIKGTDWFWE
jgi:hypothetical protein